VIVQIIFHLFLRVKEYPKDDKKKYLEDKKELDKYLDLNEDIKKLYKRNEKIIDFNFIPKKYRTKLESRLKKELI